MKIRLLALIVVCLLSSAVLAQETETPTPTLTPTPVGSYIVRADIYVRGGPGEHYLPVGSLVAGNVVQPLNRNATATWVLIAYGRGFGWIRRDLAYWAVNVDALPLFDESNLTPTTLPGSETPTAFFVTATPSGNWVNVGPQGAYLRGGPGTQYLILGELQDGDGVEPVSRDRDGDWILIRFGEGFAWISRFLVHWVDDLQSLPVLFPAALTPSATFTGTLTPTDTPTASQTASPTLTTSPSDTASPVPTNTPTATASPTEIPTDTEIPTETATDTAAPSETPTALATNTPIPTDVPTATPTFVPTVTDTSIPTGTTEPTHTETEAPTATNSATAQPSDTPTMTATDTATELPPTPSETSTTMPSGTPTQLPPSETPAQVAVVASATPVWEATASRIALQTAVAVGQATVNALQTATAAQTEIVVLATNTATFAPSLTPTASPTSPSDMIGVAAPTGAAQSEETVSPTETPEGGRLPVELVVGAVGLLLVVGYVGLYWRGLAGLERYANGFVIEQCPVCGRGQLMVETRHDRMFGVPRGRTTVRCSVCRSVLREAGNRRWRYAVDRIENPALYERLNGRVVDELTLKILGEQPQAPRPVHPRTPTRPPKFEDEE